ncbi:BRCA1-A complex subunit RAP80 isoform X2 [Megalops cyprinoides]|uniref:BRCA1-A complex subunit RAP80 isoform X2 n=1 Tax=Megalops cyprinoides TaxID=118141 RepID=UPI0018643622|nr:BRCA1-A complex subunit RAP80 isoform X2 [Megalops cyprinoides]
MPRKKRGRRKETDDDVSTFPSKRRHTENQGETVVISDSDNEEDNKPTPREERMRGRENRAQNRELTEEEMLDLAMRLSEQEAALRQQQEEEAMRKAIAESLHANGTQANNGNSESLSLLTSPTSASQPSQGHSPPPASESPVFPLRQKSSRLSLGRTKQDGPAEEQFTTATVMDTDKNRKAGSSLCHVSLSQPISPESPLVPQFSSEKEIRSLRKDPDTDLADSDPQHCSSKCHSQPEISPIFPKSPAHRPVICVEKLSQDLLVDCHTMGFVLCSQKDPAIVTASGGSQSSPQLSPAPPESPTFPGTNPREDEKLARGSGTQSSQEPITTVGSAGSGDKEHSAASPHKQGCYPRSKDSSNSASVLKTLSASVGEQQSEEQPCHRSMDQKSKQRTSEDVLHDAVRAAQPNQDFTTQMALRWSDEDDDDDDDEEGDVKKKQDPVDTDQTRSPPKSQNVVCEESSASDSESLLRLRTSPVFPREATCSKPVPTGASPKPTPPMNRLNPLAPAREGGSGVRRKLTFRDMYAAQSAAPSNPGKPFHSEGSRIQGSPSLQGRACSGQPAPCKEKSGEGVVLYYWGVPFCPHGQNPDDYTQVILSQLEVYEKSLKEARRGLLRKAEWGEPVLPGPPKKPFSRRGRFKRHRAPPLQDDEEEEETQVVEEEAEDVEEVGEDKRADSQKALEESGGRGDEVEDSDTPVILSPRPVQQRSPLVFRKDETPEKLTFLRRRGLRERCPVESDTQPLEEEEEEEEEGMCPETQMSENNTCDLHMESPTGSQHRQESEEMETEMETEVVGDRNGMALEEEEEEEVRMEVEAEAEVPEPVAQTCSETVECPICMRSFPLPEIEMHAAYCDGAAEESVPVETHSQVMSRRKIRRRPDAIEEDQPSSSGSGNRPMRGEKCFLCHSVFPVEEYSRHVEACISHRSTRTSEGAKNLLTALDQSEQKDSAGPSHSSFKNTEHSGPIFLLDTDGSVGSEDAASPGYAISTSPIRSFTSISEATDCLVDFKHQYSSKPTQRAGRKRKFKR